MTLGHANNEPKIIESVKIDQDAVFSAQAEPRRKQVTSGEKVIVPHRPTTDSHIRVSDLYQQFGRDPRLPKLLSTKTVLNTIEDAVRRGVLAVRCVRSDQSEAWFWHSGIDVAEWGKNAEAWLPAQATLNALSSTAVLPTALPGLWPKTDDCVRLSDLFTWFDGTHSFEEETQPGYPAEARPIPIVDYSIVRKAVSKAIQDSGLWLVYGNDSVFSETPTEIQLDGDALQTPAGRRASSLAVLDIAEIQDLADQIHALTKPLAGMDPQIEVRITVKTKGDGDLSLANGILDKIKAGWKL